MNVARVGAKIYAASGSAVDLPPFIPAFHGWIQRGAVDGLLIDVADYQHVPDGPGIMLIGHEADRALDLGHGRPGMLYQHKRDDDPPPLADGVRRALRQAALAAAEAETDPALDGAVTFPGDEVMVRITDRLLAPPGDAAQTAVERAVRDVLSGAGLADGAELRADNDPKAPVTVVVTLASRPGAAGLAEALGQAVPVSPA